MKQSLILTLLIMVSICTSMAQQMDRPNMKPTPPIQQERSDSSIEQPCLIDRDLPAQQTAASIVTESLNMGLSATLSTPVQSDFFENMRSDAAVNTPLAIGNKPPKETKSSDIGQPEPQKKRSKIRISLFKKPEGKEQTRRVPVSYTHLFFYLLDLIALPLFSKCSFPEEGKKRIIHERNSSV